MTEYPTPGTGPLKNAKTHGTTALKMRLEAKLKVEDAGFEFTVDGGETDRWDGLKFYQITTGRAKHVFDIGIGALADRGYMQIATLSVATGLGTIPPGAAFAVVYAEGQDVRWRQDRTNPTSTVGNPLHINQGWVFGGDLTALKFIQVSALPAAILNVQFYG